MTTQTGDRRSACGRACRRCRTSSTAANRLRTQIAEMVAAMLSCLTSRPNSRPPTTAMSIITVMAETTPQSEIDLESRRTIGTDRRPARVNPREARFLNGSWRGGDEAGVDEDCATNPETSMTPLSQPSRQVVALVNLRVRVCEPGNVSVACVCFIEVQYRSRHGGPCGKLSSRVFVINGSLTRRHQLLSASLRSRKCLAAFCEQPCENL